MGLRTHGARRVVPAHGHHHLKGVLLDAGLLARDKPAPWTYYCIVPERHTALPRALEPSDAVAAEASLR